MIYDFDMVAKRRPRQNGIVFIISLSNLRSGACITVQNSVSFKIRPEIWTGYMVVGHAGLILYLDTKLPDPFYVHFFFEIGNLIRKVVPAGPVSAISISPPWSLMMP